MFIHIKVRCKHLRCVAEVICHWKEAEMKKLNMQIFLPLLILS